MNIKHMDGKETQTNIEQANTDNTASIKSAKQNKKSNAGIAELLIPFIAALMLVFTVMLAITLKLIDTEIKPGNAFSSIGSNTMQGADTTSTQTTNEIKKINDYRAKPQITSASGKMATAQYKPTGGGASMPSEVKSKSAILVNVASGLTDGTIVAEKNCNNKLQIASMTKVMTLIVCCDYISEKGESSFYEVITLDGGNRELPGYSCAFFTDKDMKNGKKTDVYVIDALYGLALESGADCAYGLVEHFGRTEDEFVKKMNEKAKALGMNDTTFTNSVGKDDGGKNISTVRDVATMFAYALDNPLCREILTAKTWLCVGTYTVRIGNSLQSLVLSQVNKNGRDYGSGTVLGGKSGNESMAGYCLVTLGKGANGTEYICVTAGSDNAYNDTAAIYRAYVK